MSDEHEPEEQVEDLDVPESEAAEVKGGIKGESKDHKHPDEIHIESFKLG